MYEAFEQLLRYSDERDETTQAGLQEGEPRLFFTNLLLIRTCGEQAEYRHDHFGRRALLPLEGHLAREACTYTPPLGMSARRSS